MWLCVFGVKAAQEGCCCCKDQNFREGSNFVDLSRYVPPMPSPKDSSKIYQKWSSRCKANKMLQDGLKNGSIDPSMKPKDVWESAMEFQKYSLQSFRSAFNRKKTEMGAHLRDDGTLFPK